MQAEAAEVTAARGIARVAWEANRALQAEDGDVYIDEPWDAAPEWRQQLCTATVGAVRAGLVQTAGQAHEFWMTQMVMEGWRWGAEKDPERKRHPSLVPWADLSPRMQLGQRLLFLITQEMTEVS